MTAKFSINAYKSKDAIRVYLRPEELVMLYSHAVSNHFTTYWEVLFREDSLLVDRKRVLGLNEIFEILGIIPDRDRNREWYEECERSEDE